MKISRRKYQLAEKFLGKKMFGRWYEERFCVSFRGLVFSAELDGLRSDMYNEVIYYRDVDTLTSLNSPSYSDMLSLYQYIYKHGRLETDLVVLNGLMVRK